MEIRIFTEFRGIRNVYGIPKSQIYISEERILAQQRNIKLPQILAQEIGRLITSVADPVTFFLDPDHMYLNIPN